MLDLLCGLPKQRPFGSQRAVFGVDDPRLAVELVLLSGASGFKATGVFLDLLSDLRARCGLRVK